MRLARSWVPLGLAILLCGAAGVETRSAEPGPNGSAGGRIVFSGDRSGAWRIWSIRPDGSELERLTDAEEGEHDVDPALSRDGRQVLFTSTRGGKTGIWKMSVEGGKAEWITDGDQAEWAPDGRFIVFRRGGQLFTRELAKGEEKRISPEDWLHCSGPAFRPDGREIAFACRWDADNAVFVVPAAGGDPRTVYDRKPACEPHWSPDGARLVYETETQICTIDPDGKRNRPVTFFGGVQRYGRFSPDGQWIVYCQGASERGPWELYLIPAQGGAPRRLTEGASDLNPDWR